MRLVFPPILAYPIFGVVEYLPIKLLLPKWFGEPFMLGLLIGYIIYDETHYFLHFCNPT